MIELIQDVESEPLFIGVRNRLDGVLFLRVALMCRTLFLDADTLEPWVSSVVLFAGCPPFLNALFQISWSPHTLGLNGLCWL